MNEWQIEDVAALRAAFPQDGYVRYALTDDAVVARATDGWAWLHPWRPHGHVGGAAFPAGALDGDEHPVDAGAALMTLLDEARRRGVEPPEWFSTAPGQDLPLPEGWRGTAGDVWEFWWCDRDTARLPEPGGYKGGVELVELDDLADAQEIETFARTHNPHFEGYPGRGFATLWLGTRDEDGRLTSVGALHQLATGVPHLAGIVVDADQRGRGLGRRLTAELVRRSLERSGAATLGVFAGNAVAVNLYASLGFRRSFIFCTRGLTAPDR